MQPLALRAGLSGVKKSSAADLAALAVVAAWGVNFPLLKIALGHFGLYSFTFLRFAAMVGLAWAVIAVRPERLRVERRDWGRIAASAVVGYTLYIGGSLAGVFYSTAFSTALLIAAAPAFAALLLWAFRMEAVGPVKVVGLAVSFAGVALFVGGLGGSSLLGNLINAAAAFCYAAYNVINKPLVSRYPARVLTAWTLTLGAAPLLVLTAPGLWAQDWSGVTAADWAILAWSAVVPVYVAWTVWHWVQGRIGVNRPVALLYLVPVIAGAVSWALVGESFSVLKVAAGVVVLVGVLIARREVVPAPKPVLAST